MTSQVHLFDGTQSIVTASLHDNVIELQLDDGTRLEILDDGQLCCETRYITTDDDLGDLVGGKLRHIEVASGPSTQNAWGDEYEMQFLRIYTTTGTVVFETHNEHNGYYGGFDVVIRKHRDERDVA